ncbi:hypothetical protein NP493_163g04004 [Ridgeia piscesae]|uniref:Uncharacterized protein n=1 Tax=Ridgeia piscesae TaxID=27915 RepID=A0AAD9UFG2_RIDPI|nr:hypothetical protein NP493_163g04004 [Ridgeia piscesae]
MVSEVGSKVLAYVYMPLIAKVSVRPNDIEPVASYDSFMQRPVHTSFEQVKPVEDGFPSVTHSVTHVSHTVGTKMEKVLTGKLTFQALKPCNLNNCTKGEIRRYFENIYDLNESIFTALKDTDVFYVYPDRLRLPLIFYYGHTACVYINKLVLAGLLKPSERVNLSYETLFETGVDEMSWDDTVGIHLVT